MNTRLWFLPIAFVVAALWLPGAGCAATIRDQAGLFSDQAVSQASSELDRIERETKIPTTVETIASLEGENIREVLDRHAKEAQASGLYVLIAKKETKIEVEASRHLRAAMPAGRIDAIKDAFLGGFKKKDFDAGLLQGVKAIGQEAALARADAPVVPRARPGGGLARRPIGAVNPAPRGGGGFGLGSLLWIGLLVVGGLFLFRLLGSLLGGGMNRGAGGSGGPMGRPGYCGGGGGFMSSLFGGIGGAMAGNWLYDQFSGRHHGGYGENASYDPGASNDPGTGADAAPDDWGGGGSVGDWGGGGGGDAGGGGGDWGGGDAGGGGGGSGGDW